ncbi:uncharacterized protein BDV17DRAFT_234511 [Aspergillus undulatus]|uniref:uncharacterized protein n=1 Tax=Aspergillus undulatus TaxID=1810928 RepID=UPI003CCCB6D8
MILIATFVCVPGAAVPRHTPAGLIWRHNLWEFHICTLGFALPISLHSSSPRAGRTSLVSPWHDLLDRCQPNVDNARDHAVGGFAGESMAGLLYSASIRQQEGSSILVGGFRSYPGGHSSASAAGLVYLSLSLASKFTVAISFVLPGASSKVISHAAFPSRMATADPLRDGLEGSGAPFPISSKPVQGRRAQNNAKFQSLRHPCTCSPLRSRLFALSIYISASRWFDFRGNGFDILFGHLIGLISAVYSFRYYRLSGHQLRRNAHL